MRELAEVAPGVLVATAGQYTTTSTVVVGADGSCLVVDPAISVIEVTDLAEELARRNLRPVVGWATHAHWDHILWCSGLGNVPRYTTHRGLEVIRRERAGLIEGVNAAAPGHDLELFGRLTALGGNRIPWDGPAAMVVEHDAHEIGHGAIVLSETGTLLAGDMLSDVEMPLLYPGDRDPVGQYLAGLEMLAALGGVRTVVPGHGHAGDAAEFRRRVDADRRYLDKLVSRSAAADDERIVSGWLQAEHERQVRMLHG